MDFKRFNFISGTIVFLITLVIYVMTVQPTLSLWDCGEFLACAYTLSTPHPPGAPLHILVGRIFTMIPFGEDIGFRMNMLSVISSALSVLMLYLVSVKAIKNWRGKPKNLFDIIIICIPSAIGALSYAFSDSFWFNAMEAEVYGFGTFLIAVSAYLLMLWWEKADEKGSDKYLLMVAYIVGLSIGIHLLVVQMMFIAGLIFYFKRFQFSNKGFVIAVIGSMLAFFIVYPFIVKKYPLLIMSAGTMVGVAIIAALVVGIFYFMNQKNKAFYFACLALFLVIIGYSTYISVLLRSEVKDLPINENNPNNIERLISYLNREQYGEQPLIWPRRYSQEPMHERTRVLYSSDLEFMWKYQINHMFNRYLFWNYIGRAGWNQDDGVDFKKFYAIPFIFALIGIFHQFRKDWKLAIVFMAMFLVMGIVTTLYQNQQDPQPRERDYFYVGAFFVFSFWIGVGVLALIEITKDFLKNKNVYIAAGFIMLAAAVFVPFNMARVNYKYQDRGSNYFPFVYAYNLLQSVEKDAILITNGDNDTFPLWCLQAVYGVRQDVRIVNLSLAQIDWYNLQLKNERPYGALTVPFTMTDQQIRALQPQIWPEHKYETLDVPLSAYPDSMRNNPDLPMKIRFDVQPTYRQRQGGQVINAIKTNDLIVLDILKANKWQRPFYFSITVSPDYYVGLSDYLVAEGMAQRLVPYMVSNLGASTPMNVDIMRKCIIDLVDKPSKTPQYGFMMTGLNNKNTFYEEVQQRMIESYRSLYISLAQKYSEDLAGITKAIETLDYMEKYIPSDGVPMDFRTMYSVAMLYNRLGVKDKFNYYADEVERIAIEETKRRDPSAPQRFNPYMILLDIYDAKGEYNKELDILNTLVQQYPNDPSIRQRINMVKDKMSGTDKKDTTVK